MGAALCSNHGSFSRSLLALMSEAHTKEKSVAHLHDDTSLCPLCSEHSISARNTCGHGLCASCWTDFVAATVRNSSTPEVQKGNDDDGGSMVLDVKCPADTSGKCRCPVQFSILRQALPDGIENLVRTVMRSMSRLFLSGAAAIAQCVCGAVVCSTLISSEVECACGFVQCIGDMKRGASRANFIPHPHLSSDEEQSWQQLNTVGSDARSMIMRYKNCPKCGTLTTKCGCQGKIQCAGMDKCPQEACDHMVCSKCRTDWCWICRRIGSTEPRCSRPESERKDTKELLLRIGPEVQELEQKIKKLGLQSLLDSLELKDSKDGVISSKLNHTVLSISGIPVKTVDACKHLALKILYKQCVVLETSSLQSVPSTPQSVPLAQRNFVALHAPGYFSGSAFPLISSFDVVFSHSWNQAKSFAQTCALQMNLCVYA
jgi:hypothetical protein